MRLLSPKQASSALISVFLLATGCSDLPKVQSWEKSVLAKPSMALDQDPLDTKLMQHIHQSKEAASGGYGAGGGGCGCN